MVTLKRAIQKVESQRPKHDRVPPGKWASAILTVITPRKGSGQSDREPNARLVFPPICAHDHHYRPHRLNLTTRIGRRSEDRVRAGSQLIESNRCAPWTHASTRESCAATNRNENAPGGGKSKPCRPTPGHIEFRPTIPARGGPDGARLTSLRSEQPISRFDPSMWKPAATRPLLALRRNLSKNFSRTSIRKPARWYG